MIFLLIIKDVQWSDYGKVNISLNLILVSMEIFDGGIKKHDITNSSKTSYTIISNWKKKKLNYLEKILQK